MMTAEDTIYRVYRAPGWHGRPTDPLIHETDDEREAAMMAGCRVDLGMPGQSNRYSAYAVDPDGEPVDRIESYECDECGRLHEWGDHGPIGVHGGIILGPPPVPVESHLVTWCCPDCADAIEAERGDEDD